jgi:hypothetical protein
MRRYAAVVAIGGLVALGLGGRASAAGPALSISATTTAYGASGSTILRFSDDGPDPVATIDIYAPRGYGIGLSQPFGATIGGITAQATNSGTSVKLAGAIKVADPASYVPAAATCTPGHSMHDAVWTLALNGGGLSLPRIPLFVDRLSGTAVTAPARLRACLPSPATADFPIRLTTATLTLNGVFENPPAAGEYRWTTVFTTYSATDTPALESQTLVRLPPRLTLAPKVLQPHGARGRTFVRLSGRVTENGRPVSGARVEVLAGPSTSALDHLAFTTSFTGGKFAIVAPLRRTTVFKARVSVPLRRGALSLCTSVALEPDAVCSSVALAPFVVQSRTRSVVRRRVQRPH